MRLFFCWLFCVSLFSNLFLSESLVVPAVLARRQRHSTPCIGISPGRTTRSSSTTLHSNKNSKDFEFDGAVLTGDLLAIVVACQLIGLIDVLNDSHFWDQGGFAQSIPAVPSTLGTFVQRVSLSCLCWIVASLGVAAKDNNRDGAVTIGGTAQVVTIFLASQLALAYLMGGDTTFGGDSAPLVLVLRDCYIITIVAAGWRYFYKQFYDSS
jgi:hypothetical protein